MFSDAEFVDKPDGKSKVRDNAIDQAIRRRNIDKLEDKPSHKVAPEENVPPEFVTLEIEDCHGILRNGDLGSRRYKREKTLNADRIIALREFDKSIHFLTPHAELVTASTTDKANPLIIYIYRMRKLE